MSREINPVTRMLIRLNMIMRNFKEKHDYPVFYVVDRVHDRSDVVVLIVDVLYGERERAEEVVKRIIEHLSSYNIKVLDYMTESYMVPFREVWRLVAMVAVNQ